MRQYLLWALGPILALLLYQILFRTRRKRHRAGNKPHLPEHLVPGLDSEFYQLEKKLGERGIVRKPEETFSRWLTRAAEQPGLADLQEELKQLLRLHYRYRFDPMGLDAAERERLRNEARVFLGNLANKREKPLRAEA